MQKNKKIIIAVAVFFLFGFLGEAHAEIGIGSTRQEVISAFGQPSGQLTSGEEEILTYPGGIITIVNNQVSYIDSNFVGRLEERRQEDIFKVKQRAKGLVFHQGRWISAKEKAQLERKKILAERERVIKEKLRQEPIMVFSAGGQAIDINKVIVPGKVTIIDFYADWCGPCRAMSPYLEQLAKTDEDVFLRKIDIVDWSTPVVKQFGLSSIPNVRVFNRRGQMVGQPTYSFEKVKDYVTQAK